MYSKIIPIGQAGSLTVTEAEGVAKLVLALSEASGGALAGVVKGSVSAEAEVSAKMLVDAALDFLAAKYPSASIIIESLKGIIDAEVASL